MYVLAILLNPKQFDLNAIRMGQIYAIIFQKRKRFLQNSAHLY